MLLSSYYVKIFQSVGDKINITLLYDTFAGKKVEGSCGAVTHLFRKAFKKLNYSHDEIYVPLSDKTSEIVLPKSNDIQVLRLFFDELFPRCKQDDEFFKHPNITIFLLRYFQKLSDFKACSALFFCSNYLMKCFEAEAMSQGIPIPYLADTTLALPIVESPEGYSNFGSILSKKAINELSREFYVGHCLQPNKIDCFANLSLIFGLNEMAKKKKTKHFILIVPVDDFSRLKKAIKTMPIPKSTINYFFPIDQINNRSVVALMKKSDFALCYNNIPEAFGFYPAESIYCGSPLFTNGSGNVRHLVPSGFGLFILENVDMYFGSSSNRITSYVRTSQKIFELVTSGFAKKKCLVGKNFIQKNYSQTAFTKRLNKHIQKVVMDKQIKTKKEKFFNRIYRSPYLRMADWENGKFVTDIGHFENKAMAPYWRKLLMDNVSTPESLSQTELDIRVLFQK